MGDYLFELLRDWMFWLFAGLGISLSPDQYLAGLFFALAAGSLVARHRRSNRKLLGVIATAAVVSTITVMATQEVDHFGLSPQLIMALSGGASGAIINMFIRVMDETQQRSGRVVDILFDKVLPDDKDKDQ